MFGQLRRRLMRPAPASRSPQSGLASRSLITAASARANEQHRDLTDPYFYTRGRWLNGDMLHREARYVKFDFAALCAKAISVCTGATKVVHYEKKEGGFNRVFLLCLDNGARVIARVPFRIAGPRRLNTNSEVVTMAYVRSFTKIPIPKVLDWSDDDTSIGTEYIMMEHARGIQLHDKWASMSAHQHMLCVKKVALMMTEMARLPFPVYGSLYFADAPINPELKSDFVEGFCIGPHCGTQYWNSGAGEARFDEEKPQSRGPWSNLQSYFSGLIHAGLSHIPVNDESQVMLSYRGSISEHLHLLEISNRVLQNFAQDSIIQKVAAPILLQPDIHKRNIFVSEEDPSCITAIIDWQSTSIEPAFVYASNTPDLVEDPTADVPILEHLMPLDNKQLDTETSEGEPVESPEEEAARKRQEKDVLTCRKTFEIVLRGYMRTLHDVRALEQTLLRPIRYCDASWKHGAAALRQELIDLSQRWTELGLPGHCPYQPTPEELAEHGKQYEDFETVQQLTLFLKRTLGTESDGWISVDRWAAAQEMNTELFGQWLESIADSGGSEERVRALWPFSEIGFLQKNDVSPVNTT
ncbi:hypothetical protein DE146DRAFT_776022 [Phaeosphaeria sp. MPI-PUGE-AT-0046c]|nr:hypothetical protein DE146DRAFT_776022 [Phaeosphaeria sp. MPI-PUGE-AT-0046c]